jgi:two-component system CheB/CheR fusion protein
MAFLNGALQLLDPTAPRGHRLPIDFFFRSLALDQHERAIGIVLSGTGSDGTAGLKAIKGEGGMIMAQNPGSTQFDGMPRSAIATGLMDYELPPAKMPLQLIAYAEHAFSKRPKVTPLPVPKVQNAFRKILSCCGPRRATTFLSTNPAPSTAASKDAWRSITSKRWTTM